MKALILLSCLSFSSARAAEPAGPVLKAVKTISFDSAYGMDKSRFLAPFGESDFGVWDLKEARQIALVQLPGIDNRRQSEDENGNSTHISFVSFSPDGKLALVGLDTQYWKKAGNDLSGKSQLDLVSIPDQRVVRKLADVKLGDCNRDYGLLGECPSLSGVFSPDGKEILYRMVSNTASEHLAESIQLLGRTWPRVIHHHRLTLALSGLSGDPQERQSYDASNDHRNNLGWTFSRDFSDAGFLNDGRPAAVFADGAGCAVKDLSGKQISFLEGCSGDRKPQFQSGLIFSTKGSYTVWDPLTGAVKYKLPLLVDGERIAASDDLSSVVEVSVSSFEAVSSVKITDASTGKVESERLIESPPTDGNYLRTAFDGNDGRLILSTMQGSQYRHTIYRLGAAAPAPATASVEKPEIDVDAVPATRMKTDPDAYAVVIGIEKYRQEGIPAVDFAERDARTMYSYLTKAMGYDPKNVVLLTDANATKTDLEKNLGTWLENRADAKSRVFIYYAGHGSPNPVTGEGYLMPYEADPNYLADTAFPLTRLYATLAKLPTKDVTVVLDACFSGQGGRSLIAKGARPLVPVQATKGPPNAVVLAAAAGSQISASDPERRHGLLTEYLLEALHGAADARGDGKLTAAEIFAYVRPAVQRAAKLQNIEQTPTLWSDPGAAENSRPWILLK